MELIAEQNEDMKAVQSKLALDDPIKASLLSDKSRKRIEEVLAETETRKYSLKALEVQEDDAAAMRMQLQNVRTEIEVNKANHMREISSLKQLLATTEKENTKLSAALLQEQKRQQQQSEEGSRRQTHIHASQLASPTIERCVVDFAGVAVLCVHISSNRNRRVSTEALGMTTASPGTVGGGGKKKTDVSLSHRLAQL
jgi:hypothetical protein